MGAGAWLGRSRSPLARRESFGDDARSHPPDVTYPLLNDMAVGIYGGAVGIFASLRPRRGRTSSPAADHARTHRRPGRSACSAIALCCPGCGVNHALTHYFRPFPSCRPALDHPLRSRCPRVVRFRLAGNDVAPGPGGAGAFYCTNIQYQWFVLNQAIRADIRVWWVRQQTGDARLMAACRPGGEVAATAAIGPGLPMRAVYVSTLLHWVTPQ